MIILEGGNDYRMEELARKEVALGKGREYIEGIDVIFSEEGTYSNEDIRRKIDRATIVGRQVFDERQTVMMELSIPIAKNIKERLEKEGGYGDWLRRYKEALEISFGLISEPDEAKKRKIIENGKVAAEKLFAIKNPRFEFSIV